MQALRNFSCNGVKKSIGDKIKPDEKEQMGKLFQGLVNDGFIGESSNEVKEEPKKEVKKESKK